MYKQLEKLCIPLISKAISGLSPIELFSTSVDWSELITDTFSSSTSFVWDSLIRLWIPMDESLSDISSFVSEENVLPDGFGDDSWRGGSLVDCDDWDCK
jgi:hypothetical protein